MATVEVKLNPGDKLVVTMSGERPPASESWLDYIEGQIKRAGKNTEDKVTVNYCQTDFDSPVEDDKLFSDSHQPV